MGLGLNVAYNIVGKYNGLIDVKIRDGEGTTILLSAMTVAASLRGEAVITRIDRRLDAKKHCSTESSNGRRRASDSQFPQARAQAARLPIYTAESGSEGLDVIRSHDIGVVLSDQMMPQMDGIAFLEEARRIKPDMIRMMLTAHGSFESASKAINRSNVFGYLTKPWQH